MSGFDGPALVLPGGLVLLSPEGVLDVAAALALAERLAARDGIRSVRVAALRGLLAGAVVEARSSATGTARVPEGADLSVSIADTLTSVEVAGMLGIGTRQVRKLGLSGRRVGGRWCFARDAVLAEQSRRRSGSTMAVGPRGQD